MPLVERVVSLLEENDYSTCRYHGCFDIAAKKKRILFLKILQNIDSFQREQAKNLKIISNDFDGHPFLIGQQTNRERLSKGIVYERFDVPALSFETLKELICYEIFPSIYRDKGGLFVKIDSDVMKEARKRKNLTQLELAEAVSVNKKTIYEHERSQLKMLLAVAEKIESALNKKITKPTNLFDRESEKMFSGPKDSLEALVNKDLHRLGFETDFVSQSPFDAVVKEKILLVSDIDNNRKRVLRRMVALKNFVSFVKKPALVITDKIKPRQLDDLRSSSSFELPVIERSELAELESGKELIRIAKGRKL